MKFEQLRRVDERHPRGRRLTQSKNPHRLHLGYKRCCTPTCKRESFYDTWSVYPKGATLQLTRLLIAALMAASIGGSASPALAYTCDLADGSDNFRGRTEFRDTTLYKDWHENVYGAEANYQPFTGDFGDANNEEHAFRFWIVNGRATNQIDTITFWVRDPAGRVVAKTERGRNLKHYRAAKFQVPWMDGYDVEVRIRWEQGRKRTFESVLQAPMEDTGLIVRPNWWGVGKTFLKNCR